LFVCEIIFDYAAAAAAATATATATAATSAGATATPSWLANSRSVRWTPRWIRPNQDEIQKKLVMKNGWKNWECSNFRDIKIFLEIISGFWENSLSCMMFLTKKIKDQDQHR